MQRFLEYLVYMFNCIDFNSSDILQAKALEELQKRMSELTISELENIEKLYEAYESYFNREANAVECLIQTVNQYDNDSGLFVGFLPEISRIEKQKLETAAKVALFSEVCELAKERKHELNGPQLSNL